jgi:hypothetical protein
MTAVQRGWLGASAPILLWLIHLTLLASLSEPICANPGWRWVPHAATAVLLALCAPCLLWLAGLARRSPDTVTDIQLRFIGLLGLLLGAASVTLIVVEEIFGVVIEPCR